MFRCLPEEQRYKELEGPLYMFSTFKNQNYFGYVGKKADGTDRRCYVFRFGEVGLPAL